MDSWTPTFEQRRAIKELAGWFARELPRLFRFDEHMREYYEPHLDERNLSEAPLAGYLATSLDELRAAFPAQALERACPALFCFPAANPLQPAPGERSAVAWPVKTIGDFVAAAWIKAHPYPSVIDVVAGRSQYILTHVFDGTEIDLDPRTGAEEAYLRPGLKETVGLLAAMRNEAAAVGPIQDLVFGRWDTPAVVSEQFAASRGWTVRDRTSNELNSADLSGAYELLLEMLVARNLIDYPAFRGVFKRVPQSVPGYYIEPHYDTAPGPKTVLRDWARQLLRDARDELTEANLRVLEHFWTWKAYGAQNLIAACTHLERLRPPVLEGNVYTGPQQAIRFLAEVHGLEPDDDPKAIIEQLRRFPPAVLRAVLPFAKAAQLLVLRALGWERAEPLLRLVLQISGRDRDSQADIGPSADPDHGLIDRARAVECLDASGDELAKELFECLRASKVGPKNTLMLLEATKGRNRAEVVKGLGRDVQTAIKAYGLLPLEGGDEELLERYLRLKEIEKGARKYGIERQANTRAAAQVGLANLAQTAGFPDHSRLEWAMERRLSERAGGDALRTKVRSWELEVELSGLEPRVRVRRGARDLATVPPAVRKSSAFVEMQDTVEQLRGQVRRLRRTFETMMVPGDALGATDVDTLLQLPMASALLRSLILVNSKGEVGLLEPQLRALIDLGHSERGLLAPLQILHVHDLWRLGVLADWQREVARRQVAQPFKQAFRELYAPTPSELGAVTYSNRFAGRDLDGRVAARLFQSRAWQVEGDETQVAAFKPLDPCGVVAVFAFPGAEHHLSANERILCGPIQFYGQGQYHSWDRGPALPLDQVPPVAFSEVMRDADLVVSVAGREGQGAASQEAIQRRGEVVAAAGAAMGVDAVTIDGRSVHVQGHLADYCVDLGDGSVLVEPAGQLTILPAQLPKRWPAFSPLVEEDEGTAAVLAKVLMLADDGLITDETILAQIQRARE